MKILVVAILTIIALPMNSAGAENYHLRGGLRIAMPMNSDVDELDKAWAGANPGS